MTQQTACLVLLLQGILEGPPGYLELEISPRQTHLGAGASVAVKTWMQRSETSFASLLI